MFLVNNTREYFRSQSVILSTKMKQKSIKHNLIYISVGGGALTKKLELWLTILGLRLMSWGTAERTISRGKRLRLLMLTIQKETYLPRLDSLRTWRLKVFRRNDSKSFIRL